MTMTNVILLAILVAVLIFDSIMQNGLREKLRRSDIEVMRHDARCTQLEGDLRTVLQRDEAKRSHHCLIRDQKIKELEEKNAETVRKYEEKLRAQELKYQTLEELAYSNWQASTKNA